MYLYIYIHILSIALIFIYLLYTPFVSLSLLSFSLAEFQNLIRSLVHARALSYSPALVFSPTKSTRAFSTKSTRAFSLANIHDAAHKPDLAGRVARQEYVQAAVRALDLLAASSRDRTPVARSAVVSHARQFVFWSGSVYVYMYVRVYIFVYVITYVYMYT